MEDVVNCTTRTQPAEPAEHPEPTQYRETTLRWVHSMIHGSAGLSASQVGGKAWNLARLADAGALVPPWVVIPAWVFDRFAAAAVSSRGGAADSASALEILQETPIPVGLTIAVRDALDTAGVHGEVAVRSSAVEEDGATASFAGQFDSVLGVHLTDEAEDLWAAVRQVWASAYGQRAAAYRLHSRAPSRGPSGMGVVVQQLVSPSVSGVAFTADPVTGDPDVVVVSSVFGLGDGLVSGELDADTYRVRFRGDRPVLVERTIATKERAVRSVSGGGTALLPVAIELRNLPSLRDEQALDVAREVRRLADALGSPQDVEWALLPPAEGGRPGGAFVALQARPITTPVSGAHLTSGEPSSQPSPRPGSATRLWENSNLIESYGGMTSPMTFSFARRAYEGVYREFARTMGVPRALLQTNRPLFASMLGYVRGRVYYNLFNWYRTLRLLPAYSLNRAFLDGMLGVDDSTLEPPRRPPVPRLEAVLRAIVTLGRFALAHVTLGTQIRRFHRLVRSALSPLTADSLAPLELDQLVERYRKLEEGLLTRWRTPIVNDFFAMIYFGTLSRLVKRWLPGAPDTLLNDLLAGQGGVASVEAVQEFEALAERAARTPGLGALLDSATSDHEVFQAITSDSRFQAIGGRVQDYLAEFGDRCGEELKLETVTPREAPWTLIGMLRGRLRAGAGTGAGTGAGSGTGAGARNGHPSSVRAIGIRAEAEREVAIHMRWWRKPVFHVVLRQTRARVRDRENLRFERTRAFGAVRRIVRALGSRLAEAGHLECREDVFMLRLEEVFAFVEGTAVTGDLAALVALRRREWERWRAEAPPPDRFLTTGPPSSSSATVPAEQSSGESFPDGLLKGVGCSPGCVRAPVRVVTRPTDASDLAGAILVAERTDPGWTLLFTSVEGLLVQRGSLLSHSAIVAREMGIPCVVSIPGLMDSVSDGDVVDMDGTTGVVVMAVPAAAAGEES